MPIRPPCNENKEKEPHGNEWHPDDIWYPSFHSISPNVMVLAEARFGADSQEPIVGLLYMLLV